MRYSQWHGEHFQKHHRLIPPDPTALRTLKSCSSSLAASHCVGMNDKDTSWFLQGLAVKLWKAVFFLYDSFHLSSITCCILQPTTIFALFPKATRSVFMFQSVKRGRKYSVSFCWVWFSFSSGDSTYKYNTCES